MSGADTMDDIISVFVPFRLETGDPLIDQVQKKLKTGEQEAFSLKARSLDLQMVLSKPGD